MTALHDDPRVRRGMERQLASRRALIGQGARPIGWKLGLGTAAAMRQHGTTAPLVGFLTDRGLCAPGHVRIGGWGRPTAEPEIAVHVAHDVPSNGERDAVASAIAGYGVAIELIDSGEVDVEEMLAGDLFHRHVVLGPRVERVALADLRGAIVLAGEGRYVGDPLELVGDPVAALAHLATHLAAFGEVVRAGDVLITGSIVPGLAVAPGQRLEYRLEPLGELDLRFVA